MAKLQFKYGADKVIHARVIDIRDGRKVPGAWLPLDEQLAMAAGFNDSIEGVLFYGITEALPAQRGASTRNGKEGI